MRSGKPGPDRRAVVAGMIAAGVPLPRLAQAQGAPVRGGVLTIVTWPGPTILNAALTTAGPETLISGKMFDGLLDYDFGMKPKPQLAESWSVSPDGLKITFKLRPNVLWHDGRPFTSKDVAFTVMEVWKVHHGRGRSTFADVTAVETPDDLTAVLVMARPAPALLRALNASESPVLPAHLYQGTDILKNPANTAPVGTGPFKFVSHERSSSLVMERNPSYWDKNQPYIDRIVFRFVADGATRSAMLESGQADYVASSQIPALDILRLGRTGNFDVTEEGYETSCSINLLDFNLDHPILKKLPVRQAIAHVIDREWVTKNIWYGFGIAGTGPIHHQQKEYYSTEGITRYPLDLKKAEALLDQAGHPRGANGVRFEINLDPSPDREEHLRVMEYLRAQLRQIGVNARVRTQDFGTFVKRVYTDRDFDVTTISGSAAADPTIGVQRFYWSKNIKKGVAFSNGTGYSNPEVDALLEAAQVEVDPEKRKQQFLKFQQIVSAEIPSISLVSTTRATIANKKVRDHTTGAVACFGNYGSMWIAR